MPITTFTRTMRHPDPHIADTLTQVVEYDSVMRHARLLGADGCEAVSLKEIIAAIDHRYSRWVESMSLSRDQYAEMSHGLIQKGFEIVSVESSF